VEPGEPPTEQEQLTLCIRQPLGSGVRGTVRFIGKSSYDLMGQWQHVQSTLLRQTLNNIYLHQRPIVKTSGGRPRVDMTSLLTGDI
jgi:hypothetical protein